MTDYKEKYLELLENNRKLKEELDSVRLKLNNNPASAITKNLAQKDSSGMVLNEIFETISSYLGLFSVSDDSKILIMDLNDKAAEVESVNKKDVIGKPISETQLGKRIRLAELILQIRDAGIPQKIPASFKGMTIPKVTIWDSSLTPKIS